MYFFALMSITHFKLPIEVLDIVLIKWLHALLLMYLASL